MTRRGAAGFTLLELLIAISIFAMIGIGSYQILGAVLRAEAVTDESSQQIARLQRAYLLLGLDFRQIVDRGIRDRYGDSLPAVMTPPRGDLLEFTRGGWRNPLGQPRAEMQRVSFFVEEDRLHRRYWRVLDRAQDSEPVTQLVLDGVEAFELRILDRDGNWHGNWPASEEDAEALPAAIELRLTVAGTGAIRWLFEVAG